ncbi:MAG: hypothetical protein ACLQJR_26595 [Stellaceae bacterium]
MPTQGETRTKTSPSPAASVKDPLETFVAQLDFGFRAANETVIGTTKAWSAVFRAYIDTATAARQLFGGLLFDWHQRFFVRPDR